MSDNVDQQSILQHEIAEAARAAEVSSTDAWDSLSALSSNTQIDSIELFEDEIRVSDEAFSGALLWHVTLTYGGTDDEISISDSFPGTFEGTLDGGRPVIESMTANTAAFYR